MDEGLLAATIQAGASMAGSMGSAGVANAYNMKLARYAADFQREMIQQQNEYNSPAKQMERYKEAGLNPNLIYGNGTSSAGNQSEIAKYAPPKFEVPDIGNTLGNVVMNGISIARQKKELQLVDQELQNKREEQFNIRAERMARDIENMYQAAITGFDPGLVTSGQERDMVLGGMRIGRYKAETSGIESLRALRDANAAVSRLDARQKDWLYNNMNDITLQLGQLDLNSSKLQYELDKVMYNYEKDLHEAFGKDTGKVDKLLEVLSRIISIFVPKVSISSGNVGNTPYRRKSVTYP